MSTLLRVADRVLNAPLLLHPAKLDVLLWVLDGRLPIPSTGLSMDDIEARLGPEANRFIGSHARDTRSQGMSRAQNGVAIVPIVGSLVNRGAWLGASSGMTSYEGIAAQVRDAANDPEVTSILLDIHSPGGEGSGLSGVASLIRDVRQTKPVTAYINDMAASAAYFIAAQATSIVASPSSILGSIGVYWLHMDNSGKLAQDGIRPTLVFAGAHKVDGNPFMALTDGAKSEIQAHVDAVYENFLTEVEQGRGAKFTASQARATEARTYRGTDAVNNGLADRIASLDQVLTELSAASASRSPGRANKGGLRMENNGSQPGATDTGISQADHTAAVDRARTEGHALGVTAERDRIMGIIGCEEAKGRETLALTIAQTGGTPESAKTILAASPKGSSLAARVNATEGALGFAGTETQAKTTKSLWQGAADRHNASFVKHA